MCIPPRSAASNRHRLGESTEPVRSVLFSSLASGQTTFNYCTRKFLLHSSSPLCNDERCNEPRLYHSPSVLCYPSRDLPHVEIDRIRSFTMRRLVGERTHLVTLTYTRCLLWQTHGEALRGVLCPYTVPWFSPCRSAASCMDSPRRRTGRSMSERYKYNKISVIESR